MVVAGDIEKAFEKYVDMISNHHKSFCPAGFEGLKKVCWKITRNFSNKKIMVKCIFGEGDLISVYSCVVLKVRRDEFAINRIFRFGDARVLESWNCAQIMSKDSLNRDGMF